MALLFEPCVGMENMNAEPKKFSLPGRATVGVEFLKPELLKRQQKAPAVLSGSVLSPLLPPRPRKRLGLEQLEAHGWDGL